MVNFKQKYVHCIKFKKLCKNLAKVHINLLQHIEIQCSRVLNRLFELKEELRKYLQANNNTVFALCFKDEKWLLRIAYIAGIFLSADKSLKDPGKNVLTLKVLNEA